MKNVYENRLLFKYQLVFIILTASRVVGLGGKRGPLANKSYTSGGGGGGGQLGIGGDQSLGGSNSWTGVTKSAVFVFLGGGGLAGLSFFARIIVGFTTLRCCTTGNRRARGSSLLKSNEEAGSEKLCFGGEKGSVFLPSPQGSVTVGVVAVEAIKKSKSSSKPLSTYIGIQIYILIIK